MDTHRAAETLASYLKSLDGFVFLNYDDGNYGHMGATVSDAILQAGINYETVVRPRISSILERYPKATTTSAFLDLLNEVGAKLVLQWNGDEKPNRVVGLAEFFVEKQIETESDLREWLTVESNTFSLRGVRGVGPKTADYIKMLVGLHTTAVDVHVREILRLAGIVAENYEEARDIVNCAADILEIERAYLDHSIWRYMSRRRIARRPCLPRTNQAVPDKRG